MKSKRMANAYVHKYEENVMAKKCLLVLVLAGVLAGGVFAQAEFRLGAGVGGYFTSDFGGGVEFTTSGQSIKTPYDGYGGFLFVDATYAELSFGYFFGSGTMKFEGGGTPDESYTGTGLDIGLLVKYPFDVSEMLSVFPLLGATYRAMLSVKMENGDEDENEEDFSALWFRLGGGVDFSFTDNIYLRGEVLSGLRLANKFENDLVDDMPSADVKPLLGHGLEAKVAVGYRF
jgi:opacity protein-like surface antigen